MQHVINYLYISTVIYFFYITGKSWKFVMGEGSREYSEEIIKQFFCVTIQQNPTVTNVAALFKRSVEPTFSDLRQFARNVSRFVNSGKQMNKYTQFTYILVKQKKLKIFN